MERLSPKATTGRFDSRNGVATHKAWLRQFNDLADRLAPYVITYDDGFQAVDHHAERDLPRIVSAYREMVSIGYANGWIATDIIDDQADEPNLPPPSSPDMMPDLS